MSLRQQARNLPSFRPKWSDQQSLPLPFRHQPIRVNGRRSSKAAYTIVGLCLITFLYFQASSSNVEYVYSVYDALSDQYSCHLDLTTLESYQLTEDITYARRYISQVPFQANENSKREGLSYVDEVSQSIFKGLDHINLPSSYQGEGRELKLKTCLRRPLRLNMRQPEKPIDASEIMFGLASTADRLLENAPTTALWLGNSGAKLIVTIPESSREEELRFKYRDQGIDAIILISNKEFLVNYFALIEEFYTHKTSTNKWFTILDDDTHYFSLQRFVDELHQLDAQQNFYVGTITEDARQIGIDKHFAYGGAGITVSVGLLERLHNLYDTCVAEFRVDPGDHRYADCIFKYTHTDLTRIEGLHQVDLLGETIGILEGPRPPINWHHYKSWSIQNVKLMSTAGKVCGDACLFQRWKVPVPVPVSVSSDDFNYEHMMFNFGVSFVGYPKGVNPNLTETEVTWRIEPNSNFEILGPLRPALVEGQERFTFRLHDVGKDSKGRVKHTYIRYADRSAKEVQDRKDQVLELIFI